MWVIYLEIGVALLLAVLIVWWTWPKNKKYGRSMQHSWY
jgi:hypothetical protein